MSPNLKKWRDAATLLLVAKQTLWPLKQVESTNYKVLTMKRSSKSSFMPDTYVFPGGTLDKSDCSFEWLKLYQKFGIQENLFDMFNKTKLKLPPIFHNLNNNNIPKYISLRICAIRETFEECGVLLCKSKNSQETINIWGSYYDNLDLQKWQKIVHKDPSKFIELCDKFEIYPDIWALQTWSNWLTPVEMPRRFDTIFFIISLKSIPSTFAEKNEVQLIEWENPKVLIQKNLERNIFLPPPQFYELCRLMNFSNIDELVKFTKERSIQGCERMLPYRISTDKIQVTLLPGDELHPGEDEAQIPNEEILEEIPDTDVMHRIVHPNAFQNEIIVKNYSPIVKHVLPIIDCNLQNKL